MTDHATSDALTGWEGCQRRSRRRRHHRHRLFLLHNILLPCLLIGLCVLGVLACVMGINAAGKQTTELTLPESVEIQELTVPDAVALEAADFVTGLTGTGIEVTFGQKVDTTALGAQEISLVFTRGNEVCTRGAKLYRFHLEQEIAVKLGQERSMTVRDFVPDETVSAAFVHEGPAIIPQGMCGKFDFLIRCGDAEYTVRYIISEDIPPQGEGKVLTVEAGTVPEASAFVEKIVDNSQVTVTYLEAPEFVQAGKQSVTLVLTDMFGNATQVAATANVIPAANGPQFSGLSDLYIQIGSSISYKTGVIATDAQDGQLKFTVETGGLDVKIAGRYTVYYTAEDADGNRLVAPRTVVVESPTGQAVRELAQAELNHIITPDMTRDEQIFAVFKRARYYVYYTGNSDKSSVENAAYEGFTKGSGDCYTYYAMVRVMLDMLGIENLEVTRVGGTSHHWWNLVLFEDGKYYHVDASPPGVKIASIHHERMTESETQLYTNSDGVVNRRPNYYVYDHSLPEYQNIEIAQ